MVERRTRSCFWHLKATVAEQRFEAAHRSLTSGHNMPYAQKLPSVKSSGNKVVDEDTEGKVQLLRKIISICMDDLSRVQVLYNKLRERQQAGVADTTLPFKDTKVLKDLDKDFLLNFVTSRSDLQLAQVVKALEHDREAILQLVMYETQLPLSLRWFPLLHSREVTYRVLCDRGDKCGTRLANFKASGGYANSMLKWSAGVYKPSFSKQGGEKARLESIMHVPTRCTKTVDESIIFFKNALAIGENWSDASACLLTPPASAGEVHWLLRCGREGGPLQPDVGHEEERALRAVCPGPV